MTSNSDVFVDHFLQTSVNTPSLVDFLKLGDRIVEPNSDASCCEKFTAYFKIFFFAYAVVQVYNFNC
jgi:hypothetical protein